ncbi:NAD(P)/FAD-dependent oxidoreductase [Actinomadura madurae]|nr:FAD/NAD(P)-binding oxidoreductase [Actinomadura madurae]MCP9977475.1 NAD(P)/FAD-dependent oxidoreductase [Actinomadura madurae]
MGSTGTGTIVIVGAGLSGLRTAERLRRLGHDGPLTLVGDEPHPPYDRPPLSKGLLTQVDEPAAAVPLRTAPYADLGIDLRLGVRATALDTSGNRLVLAGGEELYYGRLVIATGLRPRVLPALTAGPAGVHTLRSFDDLLSLRAGLRGARRVTVAGAGVLGCEIAAAARARGAEVTLVEALEQPMLGALGARVGEFVAALHRARGVRMLCSTRIRGLEGRDRVERVVLEDGSVLPTDLVVAAAAPSPRPDGWKDRAWSSVTAWCATAPAGPRPRTSGRSETSPGRRTRTAPGRSAWSTGPAPRTARRWWPRTCWPHPARPGRRRRRPTSGVTSTTGRSSASASPVRTTTSRWPPVYRTRTGSSASTRARAG